MGADSFMWGSATAAYQCEGAWQDGEKIPSNWDAFCHNKVNDAVTANGDVASDHYHHFEEDLDMMKAGNQNAYRFSIAWTRIMREDGTPNPEGIAHYSNVINACLNRGIEPLVTLYHYDMPDYLLQRGGWEIREIAKSFVTYVNTCFEAFGDRVKWWVTINEPGYDTLCSYVAGNYPPNMHDVSRRWRAMYHMLLGSALAVKQFRSMRERGAIRGDAFIGLVSDSYPIETLSDGPAYSRAMRMADLFWNSCVNDVCILGQFPQGFFERLQSDGYDLGYRRTEDASTFATGIVDFLGVNAYERILVKPPVSDTTLFAHDNSGDTNASREPRTIGGWFTMDEDPTVPKNDWGMEMLPRSIYDLLKELSARYPDTPFVITENGVGWHEVPDADGRVHDDYRIEYLKGYVHWIDKARAEGVDVRGYFVWSSLDLYSWINGYAKRYGLVYVDYDRGCARTAKDSWYWYRDMIARRG